MKFTKLLRNRMSVLASPLLISVFLLMLIGCNDSTSTAPDCSSTGDSLVVCGDSQYKVY